MRYRLTAAGGQLLDEGEGVVEIAAGALVVSPTYGTPLRVAPADVAEITEPESYGIRLVLREGAVLELSQLGRMRGQVLAELTEARATDTTRTLMLDGVGRPELFPGAVDDDEAELRLYDDALVFVPARGTADKVPYQFIRGVRTDASGYRTSIDVIGRPPLTVSRLARRNSEFLDLLGQRVRAAAGRTSAFLGSLLPGLGSIGLRGVAGLLRDGVAGARRDLDALDPTVWPALLSVAALPERAAGVATLAGLGELWLGFKQTVSVERAAVGVTAWRDPSAQPDFNHDGGGGAFAPGLGGMMAAGMMAGGPPTGLGFDGPFQAMGSMLAMQMLGTGGFGGAGGGEHSIKPRADVTRGRLTPEHTDYAALTAGGEQPTVLAFLLCLTGSGHLVYEVLNERDHASYVYRAESPTRLAELNRALDLIGFRVSAVYSDASSAGSPYRKAAERLPALRMLREAYVGRAIHTDGWAARLEQRLAD